MLLKKVSLSFLALAGVIGGVVTVQHYWNNEKSAVEVVAEENKEKEDTLVKLTPEQISHLGIKTTAAGSGELVYDLSARGKITLHPDKLAHIIPKVSGIAREATKNVGNTVKAGDVLAVLESHEIADVKAAYLAALSKQKLATAALNREEKLFQDKISAGQDLLNAQNYYEEAIINVTLAKQKLRSFGLSNAEIEQLGNTSDPELNLYTIAAPLDGTIIMRHITKGEYIAEASNIYEIADLSTVWVEIGIFPKDVYRVKEGQEVQITVSGNDEKASAKLIYVSPMIDEDTITAKAIAELKNENGAWKPGTFVNVNIALDKQSVPISASKQALQSGDGKDFLFVTTADGFEKRYVTIGKKDDNNVEIVSGLNPGEQYVENKSFLLKADLEKSSVEDDD